MSEKILRGIKIRLLPTKEQEKIMIATSHATRAAWNWALEVNLELEKQHKTTLSGHGLTKKFRETIKTDISMHYMNDVARIAIYQAILDVGEAYRRYYIFSANSPKYSKSMIKKASKQNRALGPYDRMHHPRFKDKKHTFLSFSDRCDMIHFIEKNGKMYVKLSKVGFVEIQTDHILPVGRGSCKISNPRISFVGGKWMLGCALEREKQAPKLNNYSIGIDLGLEKLAVVSYNFVKSIVFKNINKGREIRALEKRLKRYQRKLCKCYEKNALPIPDMSNLTDFQKDFIKQLLKDLKYYETRQVKILKHRIQKLYRKLTNKRKDYIHKITRQLINMLPRRIVLEDLKISNMVKNKHLSKSIYDALWYFFRQCIVYKAEEYGIEVIIADTWYPSSKTCSFCGNINKNLKLSERTYVCPCCHSKLNRDLNAARNLENYGM